MRVWPTLTMIAGCLATALCPARAAVFDFTVTSGASLEAAGSFSTGGAVTTSPGYFLLTGLTVTKLLDLGGTLDTGALTVSAFRPGAAFDPATSQFQNNYGGTLYGDFGGAPLSGSLGPDTPSTVTGPAAIDANVFTQAGTVVGYVRNGDVSDFAFLSGTLQIAPEAVSVPEPLTVTVLATGLVGLAAARRRRRL